MSARPQSAVSDFHQAIGQSATLYNSYMQQGGAYKQTHQFDQLVEDAKLAATRAGQFPHWAHLSNLGITAVETLGKPSGFGGGSLLGSVSAITGRSLPPLVNTVVSVGATLGPLGHGIINYASAYGQHANIQALNQAQARVSSTALGYFQETYSGINIGTASLPTLLALQAKLIDPEMVAYFNAADHQTYTAMHNTIQARITTIGTQQILNNQLVIDGHVLQLGQQSRQQAELIIDVAKNNHQESMAQMDAIREACNQNTDLINSVLAEAYQQGMQLDDIQAAIDALPAQVKNMLQELSVDLKEFFQSRFNVVLLQNSTSLEMLGELVAYQRAQQEEQRRMAEQKIVYRAFAFFGMIGSQLNIKPLQQAAVVANASYTIYNSATTLIATLRTLNEKYHGIVNLVSNFSNFVMLLDPVLAIGEAALAIIGLFQKSESIEQVMLRQIQQILTNLAILSQRIEVIALELHTHLDYLLNQMRLMFTYNFFLSRQSITNIEKLQVSFNYLLNVMELNFQSIFLQDLFNAITYTQVFTQRDTSISMELNDYFRTLATLKRWLLSGSKSALLTGGNITKALTLSQAADKQRTDLDILNNLFQGAELSSDRMNYIINAFIYYGADILFSYAEKSTGNDKEDVKTLARQLMQFKDVLPNIEIWRVALKLYLELKLFYSEQNQYAFDSEDIYVLSAIADAQKMLQFIQFLQTTPQLIMVNDYHVSHLVYRIEQSYAAHIAKLETDYVFEKLADSLTSISNKQKTTDFLAHETTQLESAYNDKSKVQTSGDFDKFIDIVTNYQNTLGLGRPALFQLLFDKGIRPPAIYVLALQLGLGHFEVVLYESVHGDHHGTDISMDSHRYGAQIYFKVHDTGMRYQITEATRAENGCSWHIVHDNGPVLRQIFNQFVGPRTVMFNVHEGSMTQLVIDYLQTLKAITIQNFLKEIEREHWYEQLQCHLSFYLLLAKIIGVPEVVHQKMREMIFAYPDLKKRFNDLLQDQTSYVLPKYINGYQVNLLETEAIKNVLTTMVTSAKNVSRFRKNNLQSLLKKELFDGLSIIYNYSFQLKQRLLSKQAIIEKIGNATKLFAEEADLYDPCLATKIAMRFKRTAIATHAQEIEQDFIYLYYVAADHDVYYAYLDHDIQQDLSTSRVVAGKLGSLAELELPDSFFTDDRVIDKTKPLYTKLYHKILLAQHQMWLADAAVLNHRFLATLNGEAPKVLHYQGRGFIRSLASLESDAGEHIVAAYNHQAGGIDVWDPVTGVIKRTLSGHTALINVVEVIDEWIVSASQDGFIKFWNKHTGDCECTKVLPLIPGTSLAKPTALIKLSANRMATGDSKQHIQIWDIASVADIKIEKTLTHPGGMITALCELPNNRLASSSFADNTIKIWDLTSGTCIKTLATPGMRNVLALKLWKDRLVSASSDTEANGNTSTISNGAVRVWDVNAGICQKILSGQTGLVLEISSDERILSSAINHSITLWHPDLDVSQQLSGHTSTIFSIKALAHNVVVSADVNAALRVWRIQQLTEQQQYAPHVNQVQQQRRASQTAVAAPQFGHLFAHATPVNREQPAAPNVRPAAATQPPTSQ